MPSTDNSLRSKRARAAFVAVPVLSLLVTAALLGHPATRVEARRWLLFENSPVELLTFAFFMLGGLGGLALAVRAHRWRLGALTVAFYVAYSVGLLLVGMEEVAWGQWFFHWATSPEWRAINVQGETTLHNVASVNDLQPALHFAFAAGALVGIAADRVRALAWVATPRVLAPWFIVMAAHSLLEGLTAAVSRGTVAHKLFERTSEVMEMYLAMAGWLYVVLNARRVKRQADAGGLAAQEGRPRTSPASIESAPPDRGA